MHTVKHIICFQSKIQYLKYKFNYNLYCNIISASASITVNLRLILTLTALKSRLSLDILACIRFLRRKMSHLESGY